MCIFTACACALIQLGDWQMASIDLHNVRTLFGIIMVSAILLMGQKWQVLKYHVREKITILTFFTSGKSTALKSCELYRSDLCCVTAPGGQ